MTEAEFVRVLDTIKERVEKHSSITSSTAQLHSWIAGYIEGIVVQVKSEAKKP